MNKPSDRYRYFDSLVKYAVEHQSVIVSLNYDLCLEFSARDCGYNIAYLGLDEYFDFSDNSTCRLSKALTEVKKCKSVNLLKLHGSINWQKYAFHDLSDILPGFPTEPFEEHSKVYPQRDMLYSVILGGNNKLSVEPPYLALISEFRNQLTQCSKVTVVGYSFSDKHINDLLSSWLNRAEIDAHFGAPIPQICLIGPDTNKSEYLDSVHYKLNLPNLSIDKFNLIFQPLPEPAITGIPKALMKKYEPIEILNLQ